MKEVPVVFATGTSQSVKKVYPNEIIKSFRFYPLMIGAVAFLMESNVERKTMVHHRKCAPGGVLGRWLLCAGAHNSNPPQPASLLPFLPGQER